MNDVNIQLPIASGTVALTNAATFVAVGDRILASGQPVSIHGKNGAGALTDLRISSTAARGGVLVPLATGANLNAAVAGVVAMRPAYPTCLAAGCDWELRLDAMAADYLVDAKAAASTLVITGNVL